MKLNKTHQLSDFNHMLLGVFVVVIEAQKLEVCIHKQNYMVEKLSEYQFTNTTVNYMLRGVFVVVIEAQKLEVCIHKQNYMVEKLSEY